MEYIYIFKFKIGENMCISIYKFILYEMRISTVMLQYNVPYKINNEL